jgi:hypothetical protein
VIGARVLLLAFLVAVIYWAPRWMPLAAEDELETRAAIAAAENKRRLKAAEQKPDSLTPEQRALFEDLKSARSEIAKAKVRDKLLQTLDKQSLGSVKSFPEWASETWQSVEMAYDRMRPRAEYWFWSFTIATVALGIAAAVAAQTRVARFSARVGFGFARAWLVILSFLAIALAMGTHTNPWPFVPHELVFAPIAALLGCGAALRLVDFNYPVWNSLVRGCGAPVISMAFVAIFLKLI